MTPLPIHKLAAITSNEGLAIYGIATTNGNQLKLRLADVAGVFGEPK
jgi:hypothetical protein